MAKNFGKIQPGWQISKTVKDSFDEFCGKVGSVAQEDCTGALFLWQQMPPAIREWAKLDAKGQPAISKDAWSRLANLIAGSVPMLLEIAASPPPKSGKKLSAKAG